MKLRSSRVSKILLGPLTSWSCWIRLLPKADTQFTISRRSSVCRLFSSTKKQKRDELPYKQTYPNSTNNEYENNCEHYDDVDYIHT